MTEEKIESKSKSARFTPEEKKEMLFWWGYYKKNFKTASYELTQRLQRKITSKMLKKIALKENFYTKLPFIEVAIEIYKRNELQKETGNSSVYGVSPEEHRLTSMGMTFLKLDHLLLEKAEEYITGKNKIFFKSAKELVETLKYIETNVVSLVEERNIRKLAWDYTDELEAGSIMSTAETLLDNLSDSQRALVVNKLEKRIVNR